MRVVVGMKTFLERNTKIQVKENDMGVKVREDREKKENKQKREGDSIG